RVLFRSWQMASAIIRVTGGIGIVHLVDQLLDFLLPDGLSRGRSRLGRGRHSLGNGGRGGLLRNGCSFLLRRIAPHQQQGQCSEAKPAISTQIHAQRDRGSSRVWTTPE